MPDFSNAQKPTAIEIGHNIPGIKRHEKQEAHYTLCTQQANNDFKNAIFSNLKADVNKSGSSSDDIEIDSARNVPRKYTIPASEKNKVLKALNEMRINQDSLFGKGPCQLREDAFPNSISLLTPQVPSR